MRSLSTLASAFFALTLSSPVAAQAVPGEAPDLPAAKDTSQDEFLRQAELERGVARGNNRVSREALASWAGCLAKNNSGETARVLAMDFTSKPYERALMMLSQEDKSCVNFRGKLRAGGLLFAGELAEALLEGASAPIGTRLAKAAGTPATPSFSFTDKVAICVVRSVPDQVAALFATKRDSAEESAAIATLATVTGLCAKAAEAKKPLEINPAGLRAMLATAAFRSIQSSEVPA